MSTTRFNPTANGPLHVGHIYNALVCQAVADQFILRFDDNQRYWLVELGEDVMEQYAAMQLRDLLWMGISPDIVAYQSQMEHIVLAEIAHCPRWRAVYDHVHEPVIVSDPRIEPWGTDFPVTVEKVILDHAQDVTVTVRGLELLQENALYWYLCGIFGFPQPEMIYIPRLMTRDGSELTNISKTLGEWKIQDLRARGVEPETIRAILRQSCLVDPDGDWLPANVKGSPVLDVQYSFYSSYATASYKGEES